MHAQEVVHSALCVCKVGLHALITRSVIIEKNRPQKVVDLYNVVVAASKVRHNAVEESVHLGCFCNQVLWRIYLHLLHSRYSSRIVVVTSPRYHSPRSIHRDMERITAHAGADSVRGDVLHRQ